MSAESAAHRGAFGPARPPVTRAEGWTKIYVRLPNWVGDVVMVTPALRALRHRFPAARIVADGRPFASALLEGSPFVDEIWGRSRAEEKGLLAIWGQRNRLRAEAFDAAIFFTNSFGTALPAALAGVPVRVGYRGEGRRALLTVSAPPLLAEGRRLPMPMPQYYQGILDLIGVPPAGESYAVIADPKASERVQSWLATVGVPTDRPLVVLNPGAAFGASKLWPAEHFAEVADALRRERQAAVLVLAGPGEEALADAVLEAAREVHFHGGRPLLPLRDLLALFARAALVVSTDSGPRHLAVAAGARVVALLGPTDPRWSDWNLSNSRVLSESVPCGPCHLKVCPLDHACLRGLKPARVLQAAQDLWPREA